MVNDISQQTGKTIKIIDASTAHRVMDGWVFGFPELSPGQADAVRQALPALREVALLIDAKTETVCRALAQLLPPRSRKSGPARSTPLGWAQASAGRLVANWAGHNEPIGAAA